MGDGEEVYWKMTSQVTLEKIRDYSHRLEELKQKHDIEDLSDKKPGKPSKRGSSGRSKKKYLSCAKEMPVSTDSEVIVDLEQMRQQKRIRSTSFQKKSF
ncbi:hypothetical protein TNCV_3648691 [Trichonephila clavipes]|nr:hypothetical protein TNCV_3648691 [Trichonephila clavipes]